MDFKKVIVNVGVNEKWEIETNKDKNEVIKDLFEVLPYGRIEDEGDTVYIYPHDNSPVWWVIFN